ncbi:sirohydrochlorin chelatase [Nocardia sp. 2]|uniref:Sirohydrochlorin chelatase n=1 Tax=Nocardia acididurans TaxID=2802282 RepID=A0ABS1M1U1_9NOCA|nr:CbiX/SirB N-terminal domain-containing protein [Nocardia acididurans]MBL1074622.1 sirohydrochlorin chelatase [Nocardia acididurans]
MNAPARGVAAAAPAGGLGPRTRPEPHVGPAGGRPRSGKPSGPVLVAVAHGSRDPRSAATMRDVVEQLAAAHPDTDVRLAFLDLSTPSVDEVLDAVAAEGHSQAIVVPLLLGSAFHARVDLPGLLEAASARNPRLRLTQADVLGPDPRLIVALRDRVHDSLIGAHSASTGIGATGFSDQHDHSYPGTSDRGGRIGIAVAAVGSSSASANAATARVATRLTEITGWDTEICFATTEPTVLEAVSRLRARGAEQVLVAPWFLAPGLLTDRLLGAAPDLIHAEVIGPHPALTEIIWDRYAFAATTPLPLSA